MLNQFSSHVVLQHGFFVFTFLGFSTTVGAVINYYFHTIMMARKTIEFLIKLFIVALVATAALWTYNVLDLMGVVS